MKFLVACVLAALCLSQAPSAFKIRRVIYVVPATTTTASPPTSSNTTTTTTTTTPAPVIQQIVYCTWKNNWCRPISQSAGNCKWGFCKFTG
ncbi:hypothetical protein KR067_000382 [Drosophila pandora]|nr:hypothetical protein KR067_000382 [Drosophila pandora]